MISRWIQNIKEEGQILPIIVVGVIAIILMGALMIDGGFLLSDRRTAQAAADSGALAGAKQLCLDKGSAVAEEYAFNYLEQNGADPGLSTVSVDEANFKVEVVAGVQRNSFFARMMGSDTLSTSARAVAGCLSPGAGEFLLPVAWACREPASGASWDSMDCEMASLDYETEMLPMITGKPSPYTVEGIDQSYTFSGKFNFNKDIVDKIYIIMDGDDTGEDLTTVCAPYGYMDCDIDNDGKNDLVSNGDRSWLSFNGSQGASMLKDWIENGYNGIIVVHTWLQSMTGNKSTAYQTVDNTRVGEFVLVPVFNAICNDLPYENQACIDAAHEGLPEPWPEDIYGEYNPGGGKLYFHIVGFAPFYISCVDKTGKMNCPGHKAAVNAGLLDKHGTKTATLEGYFVRNYPYFANDVPGGGIDTGNFIISIME